MKIGKSDELIVPNGNSSVWRYMDLDKFTRLIKDRSLYFCNAKRLSDQYEVTIPDSTVQVWRKQLTGQGYSPEEVELEISIRLNGWQYGSMKHQTLINCWSVSPHESYALWKIYLGNKPEGVAIRSTVGRLKTALRTGKDPHPETLYMGQVRYRNHLKSDELSRFSIVTTKKTFYKFEEELRLFILNYPFSEGGTIPAYDFTSGRNVNIDLEQLIQRVYISPFDADTVRNKVKNLLISARLNPDIIRDSEIRDN